ncbi:hypothetical protein [Thiobacillus sp.]|uniref:hypothetical protein n=1 Tax=Thiobacillus sp. TaxID=924 RepID=UPI0017FA7902|nr:hypothetical protein [Thiobacillus sp.]MBC2731776.1 hypothetical protein [Thiobacillus sp.]MBC2740514.1 hypothetical protein [Thiobacillus sp.]MBC2758629.1 hypothetical protein [Thiobacillus sp.]
MTTMMFKSGLAGLAMGLLAGCAHQVPATPNRAAIPIPTHKVPLSVGVYFSSAFENYQYSESKWGDGWNFTNLGQASAHQFRDALEENFVKVVKLKNPPSKSEAEERALDFMVAPEIQGYSFDIPFTKFQIYPATITYKINIYEGDTLSASSVVHGVGDSAGNPGFDFSENPSRSASKAVEDGINKAMNVLTDSPAVQAMALKKGK